MFVSAHRQVFEALRELDPQPDDTVIVVDVEEDGAGFDFHVSGVEAATGEYVMVFLGPSRTAVYNLTTIK